MICFKAILERFEQQGEKTGWTYVRIPAELAVRLHSTDRKSFRVKGQIDEVPIEQLNVLPLGEGDYLLAVKGALRRKLKKIKGDGVELRLEKDARELEAPPELIECLQDEPEALRHYEALTQGHKNYFTNWINSAKTGPTRDRRIALSVSALSKGWDFGQMLRAQKA